MPMKKAMKKTKSKAFATCSSCKTKAACKKAGRCAMKAKSKSKMY